MAPGHFHTLQIRTLVLDTPREAALGLGFLQESSQRCPGVCVCVGGCSCTLRAGRVLQNESLPSWLYHGLVLVVEASLLCFHWFLMPSLTYPQLLNYFAAVVLS